MSSHASTACSSARWSPRPMRVWGNTPARSCGARCRRWRRCARRWRLPALRVRSGPRSCGRSPTSRAHPRARSRSSCCARSCARRRRAMTDLEGWETVIGLEVHCELATRTKLFCGCPNLFGDEPNTNVCPVCLGLPGSLPVLNEKAVELAIRLGQALHCTVKRSVFARKNYFYPDMPKDYQVSQYDLPTNVDGYLDLPSGQRVGIERAHIEEDTGKNTHIGVSGRIHAAEYSLVDYNRAGIPLVEIVSRPDLRSADEAREYVNELRAILLATHVSDAKMEEGSMRVDANVSVRHFGDELGTRCEIKNLNSVRSLGRAIEYEVVRQVDLLTSGDRVRQETRHWDEEAGLTREGRSKEQAEDYRYFPEPDLVPLVPGSEYIEHIVATMPALPSDRRDRLARSAGVERTAVAVAVGVSRRHDH